MLIHTMYCSSHFVRYGQTHPWRIQGEVPPRGAGGTSVGGGLHPALQTRRHAQGSRGEAGGQISRFQGV